MKNKYIKFCENVYVPIFSKPWWLDAVCDELNWDVILVEKGGIIVAAMPYYLAADKFGKKITKAPLTQNNGIIIKYPENQQYCSRLNFEEKIIDDICNKIEKLNIYKYEQQYHYSFTNWLPFFWRSYKEITRYTYVIEDTSDLKTIYSSYSSDARNMLRKAQKIVKVVESDDIHLFYELNKMTFLRQNKEIPFSKDLVIRIYNQCKKYNSCKLLFAIDKKGIVHSGALIVWDEQSLYYLVNGTNPELKKSQANTLLIHESINIAHNLNLKFDFEGSVIKAVEKAFRQFGAVQKPYFRIHKEFER